MIVDVDSIGSFVVFCYDFDEYGDLIIVDEIWRSSFDECFEETTRLNLWGCPIEICQCVRSSNLGKFYKTVARSARYAEIPE